jgi:hypothetical protein
MQELRLPSPRYCCCSTPIQTPITHAPRPTAPHPDRVQGGCIIRAGFLDRIKQAFQRNPDLPNLLVDPEFAADLAARQAAWRRVVQRAVGAGIAVPGMTASLGYFDTYRRGRGTANLVQVGGRRRAGGEGEGGRGGQRHVGAVGGWVIGAVAVLLPQNCLRAAIKSSLALAVRLDVVWELLYTLHPPSGHRPSPACLLSAALQAQRDFFGSHTYERTDMPGWFHTVWDESFGSYDSITTSGYNQ